MLCSAVRCSPHCAVSIVSADALDGKVSEKRGREGRNLELPPGLCRLMRFGSGVVDTLSCNLG